MGGSGFGIVGDANAVLGYRLAVRFAEHSFAIAVDGGFLSNP